MSFHSFFPLQDEVFQLISQIAQQETVMQKSDDIISNQAAVIDRLERTHYRGNQHIRKFVESTLHTVDTSKTSADFGNYFNSIETLSKIPGLDGQNVLEDEYYSMNSHANIRSSAETIGKYSLQFDDENFADKGGNEVISPCSSDESDGLLDVSDEKVRKMYSKLSHMTKKMENTRLNRSSFF